MGEFLVAEGNHKCVPSRFWENLYKQIKEGHNGDAQGCGS